MRLWPAVAVLLASCASVPTGGTYLNPVFDRDFPDPAVLRGEDGWFYAYGTQSGLGGRMLNIQVARSRDLVRWEHRGDALPAKPRWASSKQHIWAPHVVHDRALGRYFMYYSAEPDKDRDKCLAVATANTPEGPFLDAGEPLLCGNRSEQIDPMAFDDPATGKRLLYWGSDSKPIKVQELAHDRLRFEPGSVPREVIFPDAGREYRSLIEGAWVVHRDGTYYLFFSGDRCCGPAARYALMVARARDALGPFEILEEPVLESSSSWRAPGHNSVIADDAGSDWLLYHAMPAGTQRGERVMLLDRLVYRDGWPRIEGDQPSASLQAAPLLR